MRSLSANDGTHCNDRVVPLGRHRASHRRWQLPCTGNPDDVDVVEAGTMPYQRVDRAVYKRAGDCLVEPAGDDGNTTPRTVRRSGNLSHSGRQQVSQLLSLRVEVAGILLGGGWNDPYPVVDVKAISIEPDELSRIVCQRTDPPQPQIE